MDRGKTRTSVSPYQDEPDTTVTRHLNRIRVAETLECVARCCSDAQVPEVH